MYETPRQFESIVACFSPFFALVYILQAAPPQLRSVITKLGESRLEMVANNIIIAVDSLKTCRLDG